MDTIKKQSARHASCCQIDPLTKMRAISSICTKTRFHWRNMMTAAAEFFRRPSSPSLPLRATRCMPGRRAAEERGEGCCWQTKFIMFIQSAVVVKRQATRLFPRRVCAHFRGHANEYYRQSAILHQPFVYQQMIPNVGNLSHPSSSGGRGVAACGLPRVGGLGGLFIH